MWALLGMVCEEFCLADHFQPAVSITPEGYVMKYRIEASWPSEDIPPGTYEVETIEEAAERHRWVIGTGGRVVRMQSVNGMITRRLTTSELFKGTAAPDASGALTKGD